MNRNDSGECRHPDVLTIVCPEGVAKNAITEGAVSSVIEINAGRTKRSISSFSQRWTSKWMGG